MFYKILLFFFGFLLLVETSFAEKAVVFNFTEEEFKTLKVKKVKGKTSWSLGSNERGNFIRAQAESWAVSIAYAKSDSHSLRSVDKVKQS